MRKNKKLTEEHYYCSNLYEKIYGRLMESGIDMDNVQRAHIAGVDEFHVRGASVSRELADRINLHNAKVLDVGCGLGGPCRMLADEYGCDVTGVDLSEEFIRTATKLSTLLKVSDETNFIRADATDLPFDNTTFEVVWTQHVQMNISDKKRFYFEIDRVLDDEGTFIFYDIFKKGNEDVNYPMPWAKTKNISFLSRFDEIEGILKNLGLNKVQLTDETKKGIRFFENLMQQTSGVGPPKLGLNILMGESTQTKIGNLLSALKEDKLVLISGIYKKKRIEL